MERPSLENPIRATVVQPRRHLPFLPPDLIVEILTWLPVGSLLRFRCVSKWFKTLISSSDFAKAHLRIMKALSAIKPNRVDRLFMRSCNFIPRRIQRRKKRSPPPIDWGSNSWSVYSLYNSPWIEPEPVLAIQGVNTVGDLVVGSCDGLLCSVIEHRVVVWNPCTRVMRELPAFHYDISDEQMRRVKVFGFGYDSQLDDYKVVVAIPTGNGDGPDEVETQVQVFALKTTSWRRIEDFKYGVPSDDSVKFVAGRLYYKVLSFEGEGNLWRDSFLVSLDLATEKYNQVKLPEFDTPGTLWVLESLVDRLCVTWFDDDDSCDVWVMKDPRVTDAWTKLFRVDLAVAYPGVDAPLYISDNGEALWDNDEDLFIYNSNDNTIRFPALRATYLDGPPAIYTETLVSPNMDN